MRLRLAALLLALWASAASAQNVTVIGGVTPGHIPVFNSTTTIKDSSSSMLSGILGPNTSTTNGLALFANPGGTVLEDGATAGPAIAGNYHWAGSQIYAVTDPTGIVSPGNPDLFNITVAYDQNISVNPNFSDANVFDFNFSATHGNYLYGSGTNAKTTFIAQSFLGTFQAAGQRVLQSGVLNCYGVGDCSQSTWFILAAQYPRGGDEGLGFQLVSSLNQPSSVSLGTVTSATRNTCNTTTTQTITGNINPQTVTVANGAGCTVGTWVVVKREQATALPNHEAVQITASTAGSITGTFASNQSSGVTITPAVDLVGSFGGTMGEGRVLVNISQPAYTTGTVSSIASNVFTGSGTGWSNTMLTGGDSIVPGCISLAADDFTSAPFGAGSAALHDWYQIQSVASGTSLNILSFSVSGDGSYKGRGPGAGTYTIRPCAEVLRVLSFSEVILDTNGFTWANTNQVDISIPPYPDVTGFQYQSAMYSSGGTYRAMVIYDNTGARAYQTGITIGSDRGPIGSPGAATYAWGSGIEIDHANIGIDLGGGNGPPLTAGLKMAGGVLYGQGTFASTKIVWGGTDASKPYIGVDSNGRMSIGLAGITGPTGVLGATTALGGTQPAMTWAGIFVPAPSLFSALPTCNSGAEGAMANITDGSVATWGSTVAGFGTSHVLARCNGTNWTVVGS